MRVVVLNLVNYRVSLIQANREKRCQIKISIPRINKHLFGFKRIRVVIRGLSLSITFLAYIFADVHSCNRFTIDDVEKFREN